MRAINFLGNDAAGIPACAVASAGRVAESPKCVGKRTDGLVADSPLGRPTIYFK
jgi:hypothetical protein